jgi:hypothetical protein
MSNMTQLETTTHLPVKSSRQFLIKEKGTMTSKPLLHVNYDLGMYLVGSMNIIRCKISSSKLEKHPYMRAVVHERILSTVAFPRKRGHDSHRNPEVLLGVPTHHPTASVRHREVLPVARARGPGTWSSSRSRGGWPPLALDVMNFVATLGTAAGVGL